MSISDKLAALNVERFKSFENSYNKDNSKQAILAFTGDVYQGLDASSLSADQILWAQDHVRILSGFYGLLRPLDVMQPYRLEMGTKLKTAQGKDLYEFWGTKISEKINEDLKKIKSEVIINLASQEYCKAVDPKVLKGDVQEIDFREDRDGKFKFISFSAKKARGYMTQYIVRNQIKDPEEIKGFDMEGYLYNPELSQDGTWTFTR
ncbi:UNVERIFIED_CONTAM: hypothetical protein GTU68_035269 [Idotea baltica]|nr:hypothetical protein [Idotea baltica]